MREPSGRAPGFAPPAGAARFDERGVGRCAGWAAAVVVPARDEERRIAVCLAAVAASLDAAGVTGGVVVVVNDSRDRTAAAAREVLRSLGTAGLVLDVTTPQLGGVGPARAIGLGRALGALGPDGVLLTTDADSTVRVDWIAENLAELAMADLVCGAVTLHPGEAETLAPGVWRHGAVEGAYMQASIALSARLDPRAHDAEPSHRNPAGASLAFTPALYRDLGGMPPLATGEDRAFAARADARGWRVRHSARAVVETSCRLTGRTAGGLAGALRSRDADLDPLCDEWLEPARATVLRNGLRGALRQAWPDRERLREARARWLGPDGAALPHVDRFGALWESVEAGCADLARRRLRQSDLRRELPLLLAAMERVAARRPEQRSPAPARAASEAAAT